MEQHKAFLKKKKKKKNLQNLQRICIARHTVQAFHIK